MYLLPIKNQFCFLCLFCLTLTHKHTFWIYNCMQECKLSGVPGHCVQLLISWKQNWFLDFFFQSQEMIDNVAHGGRQASSQISQVCSVWISCQWHRPPCLAICDSSDSVWQHPLSGVIILETLTVDKQSLLINKMAWLLFHMSF